MEVTWLHPVYTVLMLSQPIVEMIGTIFEDHQVRYQHSTHRNPNLSTVLCDGSIWLDFKLVHLVHLYSEPDSREHAYWEKFYQTLWEQGRPVLERSAFPRYRQSKL